MELQSVTFNHATLIKKEIQPMIKALKDVCAQNNIPMFIALAEKEDGENATSYYTEILSPAVLGMNLANDKISPMLKVVNEGFDLVPSMLQDAIEMDF